MSPLKIGIVEDDLLIAESISVMLQECGYVTTPPATRYADAIAMVEAEAPDLLLIDVRITGKMDGIEVARTVQQNFGIPFIFLTANTDAETVRRAREVSPTSFLAKPVTRAQLYASIEVAMAPRKTQALQAPPAPATEPPPLFVKDGGTFRKIRQIEILYIESVHNYGLIYLQDGRKLTVRGTLAEFAGRLDEALFIRIHRGFVAAISRIEEVTGDAIVIGGRQVPVSRRKRDELLRVLRIRD